MEIEFTLWIQMNPCFMFGGWNIPKMDIECQIIYTFCVYLYARIVRYRSLEYITAIHRSSNAVLALCLHASISRSCIWNDYGHTHMYIVWQIGRLYCCTSYN